MADGTEGLLRWENEILRATMEVRWAIDGFEKPKQRDLDTIRAAAAAFIKLAEEVSAQQAKEEEEYHRQEYGDG